MMKRLLRKGLTETAELSAFGRRLVWFLLAGYLLCLAYLCFSPQPFGVEGVTTPNIHYYGPVPVLLVPFNSFVSLGQLRTFKQLFWVLGQNVSNTFLLSPVILALLALFPKFRSWKRVLVASFIMSLTIESTQVLLDLLWQSNRVFEIDDLIFNSLGGLLAFWLYLPLQRFLKFLMAKSRG